MKLENPGKVFVSSFDDTEGLEIYDNVQANKEFFINAEINPYTFEDGSPVIKYFDSNPPSIRYTFEKGQIVDFVENHYNEEVYWFDNGIWYKTYISIDELLKELGA